MRYTDEEDENFENGILKDKHAYKVPLRLCDAMSKEVAKHASNLAKPTKQHLTDGYGNAGLALHRPGARLLAGGSARTQSAWDAVTRATEEAYALDSHWKANAWKDAVLDEDDDDDLYAAKQEAKATDCYADYEASIRDEWRRGNE